MPKCIKYLLITCFVFCNFTLIHSEDVNKHQAGVFIGPNLIFNKSKIPLIPGADDCGYFENGNALAFLGGIYYTYTYLPEFIFFDARLMYEKRPVDLSANSNGYQVLSPITNQYVPLVRLHEYKGTLEYLAFDIGVKYQPLNAYPAFVRLGFEAGNPIISSDYENTEQIISPDGVLFPDETLKHKVDGGALTNAGTALAISLGTSYSHKLKSGFIIEPALTYRKSINSVISDSEWNQDIVRLTISVGMDFVNEPPKDRPIEEPVIEIEPVQPEISEKSIVKNVSTGSVEYRETIVTQTYPILPYIFFDSLSTVLKSKYVAGDSRNFDESALPKDNLAIYYRVLDLVGSRMINYPNAKLNINGTQDGSEIILYDDNSLALGRAKQIAEYLEKKWNISPDRLKIGTFKKPTLATSESYPEGFEENRRVELSSDDMRIFEPVVHTKFSEFKPITNNLIISSTIDGEIKNWNVGFYLDGTLLNNYTGSGKIPTTFNIDEIISNDKLAVGKPLRVKIDILDNNNKTESITRSIPLEINRNKYELGRLNLIVFDFDKSEVTDVNKKMIENFAGNAISNQSEIKITGSTDRLGEADYNQKLSSLRAVNVSNLLKSIKSDSKITDIQGTGSTKLLFDNNTPEGRFYSRTVLIEVQTPLISE